MARYLLKTFIFIIIVTLLIGCGAKKRIPRFRPVDLTKELQDGKYVKKVDNLLIIIDESSSMSDSYMKKTKFAVAKNVIDNINRCLPEMELKIGLRNFGRNVSPFKEETALLYGLTDFDRKEFGDVVKKLEKGMGRSAMIFAINGAAEDLKEAAGGIAVVIVSDWKNSEEFSIKAAENMKNLYGDRICIYTIMVGENEDGKKRMEEVAKAGYCGFPKNSVQLASGRQMAGFIKKVFLKKAPPKVEVVKETPPPVEEPAPVFVEQVMFTATLKADVLFDFDSAELKPGAEEELDRITTTLSNYPEISIRIEGHTDSRGSESYNQGLSERRAVAVKNALVQTGIDPSRIEAIGLGESQLISTDDALNRRVNIVTVPIPAEEPIPSPPAESKKAAFTATLKSDVLFDFDSADLKPGAGKDLDSIATALHNYPETLIRIEGHTDSLGPDAYNKYLSEKRAAAVKDALVQMGIDPARIEAIGLGESKLISPKHSLNRRVNIVTVP
ncbi:MAG: OmpA family protein [Thermodesulfobacteriota bacterium]|nr:OmpA family protein [Thermodesulfobacteriota bacterium]